MWCRITECPPQTSDASDGQIQLDGSVGSVSALVVVMVSQSI